MVERMIEDDEYAIEWNRWQDLLDVLTAEGALTEDDRKQPVGWDGSPGSRILNEIRRWGKAVAALNFAVAQRRAEGGAK